jgi:hypothetical protein
VSVRDVVDFFGGGATASSTFSVSLFRTRYVLDDLRIVFLHLRIVFSCIISNCRSD